MTEADQRMRDVETDIFELVKEVMHQSSTRIQQGVAAEGLAIAPMEARCLSFVARNRECTQSDLVTANGRDKAQIARVMKLLIERGHVIRLPDAPGARRNRLAATPQGERLHEQAETHRVAVAHWMADGLDDQERTQLRGLLQRVAERLRTA